MQGRLRLSLRSTAYTMLPKMCWDMRVMSTANPTSTLGRRWSGAFSSNPLLPLQGRGHHCS
eukprot:5110091-Pyramimonas_sp.AAC.1